MPSLRVHRILLIPFPFKEPRVSSSTTQMLRALGDVVTKNYFAGTHRTCEPAATVARIRPHLATMGITRVGDVTGLDPWGIRVVRVTRPNSRPLSVAQGKGIDVTGATASGLMEAIESFHAERISLPLRLASYQEIRRQPVACVEKLP